MSRVSSNKQRLFRCRDDGCFSSPVQLVSREFAGTAAEAKTIQIMISNLAYVPAETNAAVGDVIEWVNNDILAHTATATNGDSNTQPSQ